MSVRKPGAVDPGWESALVVFCDSDLWWLRLLRPGFRHCFVALGAADGWVVVDPLSHQTFVARIPLGAEFDLACWYRNHEMTVVETKVFTAEKRIAPIRPYSCVEAVKRILGIRAGMALTPWQLYRHMNKRGKCTLTAAHL